MEIYILDKKLTVPVPKISLVNPKSFKRRRKLNSSLWFILVVLCQCLVGRAAAAAVSKFTVSARLGDSVSLPCSRGTDLVVFRGRHLHHLAQGDRGGFVVSNATQADEGSYLCYHNGSVVGEVELLVSAAVPLWEADSAQISADAEEADSDYLRVLGISTAISVFSLVTLVSGIALLLVRHRASRLRKQGQQLKDSPGEDESLELVPNITLNPSFNIDMLEHIEPEFHESSEQAFLVGSTVHIEG